MRTKTQGFTLVEVLVALAVLGITLAAAAKLVMGSTDTLITYRSRTLASWVASNQVNQMLAMRAYPETGSTSGKITQGGENFVYTMNISPTPNYSFRRIELSVALAERPEHILAQQVFYAARVD
ncbi:MULTISPECIES: type II secretion system minor pseudopilin GspI [Deefgea]|uniref:Type II secretion system protein I n=1 Tax=Deefgea chitinilytica TaxID=570276 RepID=A0ABS2C7R8_9NEIS|nr:MULTISPECIES: type II secretion system minor pseudopilin GspI [Deefgea]MBM5570196.1 type II secretion system protein GspI [Deefgea chitinilytica]MBM9887425.1 type II secretion system minor pseudopilin GspI [Deefgea sp. CFH1-16]